MIALRTLYHPSWHYSFDTVSGSEHGEGACKSRTDRRIEALSSAINTVLATSE
jgi:hypothetical protein